MADKAIIFFTRIPTLGKTKTRLEPFLTKEQCVALQTAFIKDIYINIKSMGIDILINYAGDGELEVLQNMMDEEMVYLKQTGKNLGEKMHHVLSFALKKYKHVVLIGSDLPLIHKKDIEKAFEILETKDMVISPTFDGGYYLIGMKEENEAIFNMRYSTGSVFVDTINKIRDLGKSYGKGNTQLDIDQKSDFIKLYNILKRDENIPCDNTRQFVMEIMESCGDHEYSIG